MFNVATRKQPSNVVLLRANQTKTNQRQKSLYEIYPLQFFDRETSNMWPFNQLVITKTTAKLAKNTHVNF